MNIQLKFLNGNLISFSHPDPHLTVGQLFKKLHIKPSEMAFCGTADNEGVLFSSRDLHKSISDFHFEDHQELFLWTLPESISLECLKMTRSVPSVVSFIHESSPQHFVVKNVDDQQDSMRGINPLPSDEDSGWAFDVFGNFRYTQLQVGIISEDNQNNVIMNVYLQRGKTNTFNLFYQPIKKQLVLNITTPYQSKYVTEMIYFEDSMYVYFSVVAYGNETLNLRLRPLTCTERDELDQKNESHKPFTSF